jgi:ABC-type transport system involved in multi-copper enzyme maturation permease subunit
MSATTASAERMAVIAVNTFRESVRQRFFVLLSLAVLALGIVAWGLRECSFGAAPPKFLLDAGFGALTFFGAVVAIVAAAESFSGEIERRTVSAVLAKPVWRSEFVLGKLSGILGLLLLFCAAGTGLLTVLVSWLQMASGRPSGAESAEVGRECGFFALMACGLVQWFRCSVLAALTLLVATYARSSLLAVTSGFAALAACSLRSLVCDAFRAAGLGWARAVAEVISFLVPDFELYDVSDRVASGGVLSVDTLAGIALYSAFYVGLFAALAVCCFRHREL